MAMEDQLKLEKINPKMAAATAALVRVTLRSKGGVKALNRFARVLVEMSTIDHDVVLAMAAAITEGVLGLDDKRPRGPSPIRTLLDGPGLDDVDKATLQNICDLWWKMERRESPAMGQLGIKVDGGGISMPLVAGRSESDEERNVFKPWLKKMAGKVLVVGVGGDGHTAYSFLHALIVDGQSLNRLTRFVGCRNGTLRGKLIDAIYDYQRMHSDHFNPQHEGGV